MNIENKKFIYIDVLDINNLFLGMKEDRSVWVDNKRECMCFHIHMCVCECLGGFFFCDISSFIVVMFAEVRSRLINH